VLFARSFRLPLATGASAVRSLAIPVGFFQLLAFGPLFLPLPDWIVYPVGVLWAVWFFAVVVALVEGFRRRASDIELSADGIAIRGGPSRGFRVTWKQIDPRRCEVITRAGAEGTIGRLILDGREVATAEVEEERRSFEALVDTVRAMLEEATSDAPPRARRRRPDVLLCDACGAPVALRDDAEVPCRYCGARVPIPDARREQIRALSLLETSRLRCEQLLRVLLGQPGAGFTNLLVLVATPPLILGGPLAAILFNEFYETRHVFRWTHGVSLFVCGVAFTYGLSLLVQAQVVGRAALRLVALRFHATPPAREGDPFECRVCGAPLSEGPEKVVVLCAYCRAENITGIDLRPQAEGMEQQAGSLEATLDERLRVRRRWRWLSLLSAVLLLAGAGAIYRTFLGPCRDGVRGGDETDIDCGGSCTRCLPERRCGEGADCRSGICSDGMCSTPSCSDGVRNGDESDVDCGGGCARCGLGKRCEGAAKNCASGRCGLGGNCERE
jgi:hypothetical protein